MPVNPSFPFPFNFIIRNFSKFEAKGLAFIPISHCCIADVFQPTTATLILRAHELAQATASPDPSTRHLCGNKAETRRQVNRKINPLAAIVSRIED